MIVERTQEEVLKDKAIVLAFLGRIHNANKGRIGDRLKLQKLCFILTYRLFQKRYKGLNNGFQHYGVPIRHRHGNKIEYVAPNGKQMFYTYGHGQSYDRDKIYAWLVKQCPMLAPNDAVNKFKD